MSLTFRSLALAQYKVNYSFHSSYIQYIEVLHDIQQENSNMALWLRLHIKYNQSTEKQSTLLPGLSHTKPTHSRPTQTTFRTISTNEFLILTVPTYCPKETSTNRYKYLTMVCQLCSHWETNAKCYSLEHTCT